MAGCATGEEAYSIAMILREALADADDPPRLQLFASDIDEDALQFARTGRYNAVIERDVSSERLERFFLKEDVTYRVRSSVREMCVFAHHSVLRDPPFSRMHLISCRNLLIYLSNKVQERLLPVLHYALQPGGYLFLGPSETIGRGSKLFDPVDKRRRIFVRREDGLKHLPKFPIGNLEKTIRRGLPPAQPTPRPAPREPLGRRAEAILGQYSPAYVIIDDGYGIVSSSRRTGRYLELGAGRPELNVLTMARPDLRAELRAAVQRPVRAAGRWCAPTCKSPSTAAGRASTWRSSRCQAMITRGPLPCNRVPGHWPGAAGGGTGHRTGQRRPCEAGDQPARGGAARCPEQLHTVTEELKTSNEELRSSNEEMSSVNEEMQSSNEELQTSKEELSINEELQTVNVELNNRVDDLSQANNYLKNLLENMQMPMVFLDNNLDTKLHAVGDRAVQPARERRRAADHGHYQRARSPPPGRRYRRGPGARSRVWSMRSKQRTGARTSCASCSTARPRTSSTASSSPSPISPNAGAARSTRRCSSPSSAIASKTCWLRSRRSRCRRSEARPRWRASAGHS